MEDLQRRLRHVERANRILLGGLAMLTVAFLLAARPGPPTVVRAQRFELVDPNGNVRAELGLNQSGGPTLTFKDDQRRPRASLIHDASQTGLFILDESGTIRVGAAQYAHGGASLALHGPGAKGGAVLYLKKEGSLTLYDAEGKAKARFPQVSEPRP